MKYDSILLFFFIVVCCRAYLDKTVQLQLNKGRKVYGTLRGYDQFMNLVIGDAVEESTGQQKSNIGMVVSLFAFYHFLYIFIYLSSIVVPLGDSRKQHFAGN